MEGAGSVNAMHKSTPTASLVSYTEHREPVAVIKEQYKKQQLVPAYYFSSLPTSSFTKNAYTYTIQAHFCHHFGIDIIHCS